MKHILFIRGLSLLLLLAQSVFVFGQTASNNPAPNDALIGLLDEPDAVAVVNVKKMLSVTAPAILKGDPAALDKVKNVMKTIESETGVNPYLLEKIVFGVKLGGGISSPMLVIQSGEPSAELVEKMYRAQVSNAKFATEINPLKNRIDLVERRTETLKLGFITRSQPGEEEAAVFAKFQTDLDAVKPLRGEQAAVTKLKTDAAKLNELFKNYQNLEPAVYDLGDLPERLTAVKAQTENISASDTQRAAKLSAADKLLAGIEKEFKEKRRRIEAVDAAKSVNSFSVYLFPEVPAEFPETAAERKDELDKLQAAVTEQIESLTAIIGAISAKEPPPDSPFEIPAENEPEFPPHPLSVTVTRKDETLKGKKLVLITTENKYPENSYNQSAPSENAILVFDEKTIVFGDRATVAKTLETKTANANQIAKNLISRAPDALAAFGADLRNVDVNDLADVFGGQRNVWQITGSLDSAGSEISLTAAFEKTDVPYNFPAEKKDSVPLITAPKPPGGNASAELVELVIKSIVGVEGKITIRFDKQKTAALIEKTPNIFSALLKR